MMDNKGNKYNTSKIPLSAIERQRQEEINRRKYEQDMMRNGPDGTSERRYVYNNIPVQSVNTGNPVQQYNPQYNGQNVQNPNYVRQPQNGYLAGQPYANGYQQGYNPNAVPFQPMNGQGGYVQRPQAPAQYGQPVQPVQPAPNVPPQKPKKRKKHGFLKFMICLVLIVSLLCGAVFGYAYSLCSKTKYVESESRQTASDVMYDDGIYNVLLVGTDRESDGVSRSDTMMLLSIDKKNEKLRMVSFLRDMWVEIPDHDSAKLNAAFAYGGADLMMQTIENNFKVRIDNYILVDFDMFKALIDGLGGVDVEITEKEAEFINRTSHAKVKSGENHLDGDYALIYVRIRKLDSDFMRTQRQRKVMSSILNQVKEQGIFKAASAATDVLPYITTDIEALDLTLKAFGAVKYIGFESDQMQIPLDEAYTDKRINGQAALKVDFDKNIEELQEFLYG